jgi:hypothetical protein
MNEYDVKAPYGNYQTKGEDDPYHLLMKMSSWNKELRSTISDVQYSLEGTIERQSQIIQDIDFITQNVTDITTEVDGANIRIGQLEITSSAVTISVANLDTRMGVAEGEITVLAGEVALKANTVLVDNLGTRVSSAEVNISGLTGQISSKVSYTDYTGNTIASLINQSATTIMLAANRIYMLGITEVAHTLNIGGNFRDSSVKSLNFRGASGGVSIYSDQIDNLTIGVVNRIRFESNTVDFSGTNVTGLYGRFG